MVAVLNLVLGNTSTGTHDLIQNNHPRIEQIFLELPVMMQLATGLSRQDSSFACQNTAVYT